MAEIQVAQAGSKTKPTQLRSVADKPSGVAIADKVTADFLIKVNDLAKAISEGKSTEERSLTKEIDEAIENQKLTIPDSYNEKLSDAIRELRDKQGVVLEQLRGFWKDGKTSQYFEKFNECSKYRKMERLYFKVLGLTSNGRKHLLELYVPPPNPAPILRGRA